MPTRISEFNESQDALTIFLNYQAGERREIIEESLKQLFDSQQYLHLTGGERNGEQLFSYLKEQLEEYNVILPDSQRLLFCDYLKLNELTEEWVKAFWERAGEFQRLLPVENMFDQHHVLCFSYENSCPLNGKKEEVIRLLLSLVREKPEISREIYLLSAAGFDTLNSQEQGLVQMLHLLSRKDYFQVLQPAKYGSYLKRICYADYYEDRAATCQSRIEAIDRWMCQENDPGLARFCGEIKAALQGPAEELRERAKNFRKRIPLYPVHISDFRGNPITGYKSTIGDRHPVIEKRREEFVREVRETIISQINMERVHEIAEKELYYRDYENLRSMLEDDSFQKTIMEGIQNRDNNAQVSALIAEVCRNEEEKLKRVLLSLEEKKKEKEKEKRSFQRELKRSGKYGNLEDCFLQIEKDTGFSSWAGYYPENEQKTALISGKCYLEWISRQYEVRGIEMVYRYPEIEPCEIVLLKEGDILDLTDETAGEKLSVLLS